MRQNGPDSSIFLFSIVLKSYIRFWTPDIGMDLIVSYSRPTIDLFSRAYYLKKYFS